MKGMYKRFNELKEGAHNQLNEIKGNTNNQLNKRSKMLQNMKEILKKNHRNPEKESK
jgi:hypothetical protein